MFNTSTQVHFSEDSANKRTVMELTTGDKPGLLAETGNALLKQNVFIRMAKIVTVGERAEDVFYITDNHGNMLSAEQQELLRKELVKAIDESQ
jgi:[protein-PII] uridylyltransferase